MGETLHIVAGLRSVLAAYGLDTLAGVFRFSGGERLDKQGLERWRERLRLALPDGEGHPQRLYLKRFNRPPLRRQVQRWLAGDIRISAARREWRNARLLADAGIPAAEAVAFGQQMSGPFERCSFILLREVPGESLERWVPVHLPAAARGQRDGARRERLDELARFVAAFHQAGFVHRDLYLSHIFISEQPTAGRIGDCGSPIGHARGGSHHSQFSILNSRYRLIDLQRVFRPRWRRRRWVIKDLAALHDSTPDDCVNLRERLRFLCRYTRDCNRFGRPRELAEQIRRRSRRMGSVKEQANRHRSAGGTDPLSQSPGLSLFCFLLLAFAL